MTDEPTYIAHTYIDNPALSFQIAKFADISDPVRAEMKKLVQTTVSEKMRVFNNDHIVFLAFKGKHVVGMAMISHVSPDMHFAGESKENPQPYLYNFICSQRYRALKASVSLIYRVKAYVSGSVNSESAKQINLDVELGGARAEKFFTRNGFVRVGTWRSGSGIDYICMKFTCEKVNTI